jgi:hypothetical protein
MGNVHVIHPEPQLFTFTVKGDLTIQAHCKADALLELHDLMSDTFTDYTIEQGE